MSTPQLLPQSTAVHNIPVTSIYRCLPMKEQQTGTACTALKMLLMSMVVDDTVRGGARGTQRKVNMNVRQKDAR